MANYAKASEDIYALVTAVRSKYHPELDDAGVTFDILLALPDLDDEGEPKGPALVQGGYSCLATVRITPVKDRVKGMADAELIIDDERFRDLPGPSQIAALDHELTHLSLVRDKEGDVRVDTAGRPRLKIRRHDHQYGWFVEVAERHGQHSVELQQLSEVSETNWANARAAEASDWQTPLEAEGEW